MTLHSKQDYDSSNSSSDSDESIEESNDYEENVGESDNDDNDCDIEPPVFDSAREIDYKIKYKQTNEEVVSLKKDYILTVDTQKSGQSLRVAVVLSDFTCKIYDFIDGRSSTGDDFLYHDKKIVDVKFSTNSNILDVSPKVYTGSEDGTIKLWDLRLKNKCVNVYKDHTDSTLKPLSCFDVSCDERYLIAGTEVLKDDAFLLFWDIRTTNLLGGYWDTHKGDITQVKFHPTEEKTVISGSVDGIINLFDITQHTEKDALQLSLNTNSSISNLKWLKDKNQDSIISCITHTEDVQLWHITDSSPFITIPRDTINSSMNIKPDAYSQVINCHQTDKNGNIMVLVGNNYGKGEYLQSHNINDGPKLSPRTLFKNNKQIVRSSWYDTDSGILVTAGEAGIINIWAPSDENDIDMVTGKCLLKELPKVSLKKHNSKPY